MMPKVSAEYKEGRRREILDAAIRCFSREGFHKTSLPDIFAESGLSPGAVYRYFPAKDDIVAALADERHGAEAQLFKTAIEGHPPREALKRAARAWFMWMRDGAERERRLVGIQVWAESLRNERVAKLMRRGLDGRKAVRRLLEAAQAEGELRGIDADALSRIVLAILQGFILQQAWEPRVDVGAFEETVSVLIDALFEAHGKRGALDAPRRRAG